MEKKYSIWERITSDTPHFFKALQGFGLGLAAVGKALGEAGYVPANICSLCMAIGTTLIIVSQFAVKQYNSLNSSSNDDTK